MSTVDGRQNGGGAGSGRTGIELQGVPAGQLTDEELERQGTYAHATRTWVLLHGTADQFRRHTERMLELEQEYVRRHPKRTWQGMAGTGGEAAGQDDLSRLRLALRGVASQIEALLAEPAGTPVQVPSGSSDRAAEVALLARFASAGGGRLHKLEVHQASRELGLAPAALARLYKVDPALLRADGEYRAITDEGRRRLEQDRA
jgi:hypothetical protein